MKLQIRTLMDQCFLSKEVLLQVVVKSWMLIHLFDSANLDQF